MTPALTEALAAPPSKKAWRQITAALAALLLADEDAGRRAFERCFDRLAGWPSGFTYPMPPEQMAAWLEGDQRYTPIAELCFLSADKLAAAAREPLQGCTYYRVIHHLDQWKTNEEAPAIREVTFCSARVEAVRAYLERTVLPGFESGQGRLAADLFCPPRYRNWRPYSPDRVDLLVNGRVIRSLFAFPDFTIRVGEAVASVRIPAPTDRDRVRRNARGRASVAKVSTSTVSLSSCTLLDGDAELLRTASLGQLRTHPYWQPFRDAVPERCAITSSIQRVQESLPPLRARNGLPDDVVSERAFAPKDPFLQLKR